MSDKYNQKWALTVYKIFIDENAKNNAITIGQTTYYSEPEIVVKSDSAWMAHEGRHKQQWARDGRIGFALKYLVYHLRHGYENNPYEVDARSAEICGVRG